MHPRRAAKFVVLLLFVAFAATTAAHALPRPHRKGAATREQILEMEEQWRQAQLADDIPAMEKLLSENFLGITVTGQVVTKVQQLDRMRRRTLVVDSLTISDPKVKMIANGQVAIVNSLATVKGKNDERAIDGSYRYTRVYQRNATGAWKITSFEATRVPRAGVPEAQAIPPLGSDPHH